MYSSFHSLDVYSSFHCYVDVLKLSLKELDVDVLLLCGCTQAFTQGT
ncbi:hypothetical protein [Ligilactobacillus salivarius]|nr:hypothetical protein [Ligilactobacillus salivarius]